MTSQTRIYKELYRRKIRDWMAGISREARREKSARIFRRLVREPWLCEARFFFTFVGLPGEIETLSLVQWGLSRGKRVSVPCVDVFRREIRSYEIQDPFRDLRAGSYGILEPDPKRCRLVSLRDVQLLIVPGLAFDRKGNRLGRGGGYFDRFLARAVRIPKIGIAFDEQILPEVPVDLHDVRVDRVLTDGF